MFLIIVLCFTYIFRSDIYPAENVIALEMSNDYFIVGGVGTQTEDSFLLTQYMLNGIPPKPGFSHSVMQTTDSFLLAKSQGRVPHGKRGKTAPAPNNNAPNPSKNTTDNEKSREKAVDVVDVPLEKNHQPKEKVKEEVDGGVDNKGAVNEGFVQDEDVETNKETKETDEELKDPKKIVKV